MDRLAWHPFASVRQRDAARRRPSRPLIVVAALAAIVVLLAACGGGTPDASRSSSTRSTTRTSSARAAEAAAVLVAYRAASNAFQHALADANPGDPALAATMVDPQLQSVKANLLADQQQGIVGQGSVTLHPKVASLSSTTATVVDCVHSASELVYRSTGKPVPPVTPPENDGVKASLVLTGGSWKLSKQKVTDGKCASGS